MELPITPNPLHEVQYQYSTSFIKPTRESDCYGIDIFIQTLEYVTAAISDQQ